MAFEILYQLRTKKFWWLDMILYFTLALLAALIIIYFIFSFKISFQETKIQNLEIAIVQIGTKKQKETEKQVFEYQKKIKDFAVLLNSHKISSNVFDFFGKTIFSDIRFFDFKLDTTESRIELTGESNDVKTLARQVAVFKENQFVKDFVKDIKTLSFSSGKEEKIIFNLKFLFNPEVLKWK